MSPIFWLWAAITLAIVGVAGRVWIGRRRNHKPLTYDYLWLLLVFIAAFFAPFTMVTGGNRITLSRSCLVQIKRLATGQMQYLADWDGRFPSTTGWSRAFAATSGAPRCPCAEGPSGYGFNAAVSRIDSSTLTNPESVLAIAEARNEQPDTIVRSDADLYRRHRKFCVVSAFGSARAVTKESQNTWQWTTKQLVNTAALFRSPPKIQEVNDPDAARWGAKLGYWFLMWAYVVPGLIGLSLLVPVGREWRKFGFFLLGMLVVSYALSGFVLTMQY